MRMKRGLLLGSAAALGVAAAGHAAELPVKAKPVQYVKVCSLYGAGFYYMPGTDMCLKIGGWTRAEATWGINGNSVSGIFGADYNNRYTNNVWTRERGYITADAREQTAFGVARGYIAVGINSTDTGSETPATQFSANRVYVQWAGFTAGLAVSFFDFYPAAALLYRAGNTPQGDTGDGGLWVWAYTAQLGGGVSATISAEERRTSQIIAMSGAGGTVGGPAAPGSPGALLFAGSNAGAGYGGWQVPDIIGNIRADETWGSAQVMAAAHQLNPAYYGATSSTGHPGDQFGWVLGGGIRINTPIVSPGDFFVTQVNYTHGATKYLWNPPSNVGESVALGASQGFGVGSDCVYGGTPAAGNATGCLMTTAWEVDAAYEHHWTPQWHESFVGAYIAESYGSGVGSANAMLCVAEGAGVAGTAGATAVASPGCNNNWSLWALGSRLQWDVTKEFYVGAEVIYEQLISGQLPGGLLTAPLTLPNSGATTVANISNWQFTIRMHKDFLP
jgi:hypothetical protein